MINIGSCLIVVCVILSIVLELKVVSGKTEYLMSTEKGLTSTENYRLSVPKVKQSSARVSPVSPHIHEHQFEGSLMDAIHIIDPPVLTKNHRITYFNNQKQAAKNIRKDTDSVSVSVNHKDAEKIQNQKMQTTSASNHRPVAAFLVQSEPRKIPKRSSNPQQYQKQFRKDSQRISQLNNDLHSGSQFFPLKVTSSVRNKEIRRTRPTAAIPHAKQRTRIRTVKSYNSEMVQKTDDFEEDDLDSNLGIYESNFTKKSKSRSRRHANSRNKPMKMIQGNLLPVALTIVGENGELLSGQALLQHITILLKNASSSESNHKEEEEDLNKLTNEDVLLNEKEFHRIMDNSMNITDSVMLTALGLNDSNLLTNSYVNEYLNCIDSSKITNRFKAMQNKIDCMKKKLFDTKNFESNESSKYSISNLPAALVYGDVMNNIKKLVRPKNGIAFYSLPVDELTHLQQVVLPIEEYPPSPPNGHYPPRSYHNRKIIFNENLHPRMPVWYVVKPDGRIYQTEGGNRNYNTWFHGFPDIPDSDVFVDEAPPPHGHYFESVYFDD